MTGYPVPVPTPDAPHREEMLIKRSRFLISLARAASPDEAKVFVERIRREFPDATHNCWAFAAGRPGDTGRAGFSDDGEPHGTAGRPMLTILLHGGIGEIAAVVTRYFGGIKLGTGGLVRAYQDMVRLGLQNLPVCEHMVPAALRVTVNYSHISPLLRILPRYRGTIGSEEFGVDASYTVLLPEEETAAFSAELMNITDGTAVILTD